jgi:hypothetical protein
MAKGAAAKQEVMATILEAFGDNAFMYNDGKEVRVNCVENGEPVQIKIALTCAKTAVEPGSDNAMPGTGIVKNDASPFPEPVVSQKVDAVKIEVTDDERANVVALMASLGI